MKLTVESPDGTRLTFEGEALELAAVAGKLASQRPDLSKAPLTSQPFDQPPGTWTDSNVRELLTLFWGDQAKLVRFLVEHSGQAPYTEIGVYMGYERQKLGAILSAVIRNARKATKDPEAQFLRWRPTADRGQIIYIDPAAHEALSRIPISELASHEKSD